MEDIKSINFKKSVSLKSLKSEEISSENLNVKSELKIGSSDKSGIVLINGNEILNGNKIVSNQSISGYSDCNTIQQRRFLPNNTMVTFGDSYFIDQGSIKSVNNEVSDKLSLSSINFSNNNFKITDFVNQNIRRFYDTTNNIVYNSATWIHLSSNDIIIPPSDDTNIYYIDNNYSIHCFLTMMLFTFCIPLESFYLASKIFPTSLQWISDNSILYGTIRTNSSVNPITPPTNATLTSNTALKGRYYLFFIWSNTNTNNKGSFEILVDGSVESYLILPNFNNNVYCSQQISTPNIHVWPIFIDMKTVKPRTVGIRITTRQTKNGQNTACDQGIVYVACWDDDTYGFRHVVIDTPVCLDYTSIVDNVGNSLFNINYLTDYKKLLQLQKRYRYLDYIIKDVVRGMQQLRLPVSINYWNDITNTWDNNYININKSSVNVNSNSFIENLNYYSNNIPKNSNVKFNHYGYSDIV